MSRYHVVRKQFPSMVAEDLTKNKSQGNTCECVVVHITSMKCMFRMGIRTKHQLACASQMSSK